MLARSSARLTFSATCSVSIVRVQPGCGTATPLGVTETALDRRVGSHERTILRSIFVAIIIVTFQKEEEEGVLMRANRKPLRLSKEMLIQSKPLRSRSFSLHPIQALRTPPSLIKLATIHPIPTNPTLNKGEANQSNPLQRSSPGDTRSRSSHWSKAFVLFGEADRVEIHAKAGGYTNTALGDACRVQVIALDLLN